MAPRNTQWTECAECDNPDSIHGFKADVDYEMGGLPQVTLKGVLRFECPKCGNVQINLGDVDALHETIDQVLKDTGNESVVLESIGANWKLAA